MTTGPDVLVVGAGPTGLTTALQAHDHGASVRVVERRTERFRRSPAMFVHHQTLESLRPLGVTDSLLERAERAPQAELHVGRRRVRAHLGDAAPSGATFPHLALLPQPDVEEVLAAALHQRGVEIERGVEVVDASSDDDAAHATLRTAGRVEETTCRFLAACDGPTSTVRTEAGIAWRGATYREEVVLADVELDGDLAPGLLHVAVGRDGLVFLFALGERATWRLLATRPGHDGAGPFGQPGAGLPTADVQDLLDATGLDVTVRDLAWSARVRLQHRLAGSFRQSRLFLAGDAAHAHSPAAAQGMNTGILDAVNLGWKLAFAGETGPRSDLLDSYGEERRPVARQVLALTHLVFYAEASTNPLSTYLRGTLLPLAASALPVLVRQRLLKAQVVRLLSQGWVHYRRSPLSVTGTPPGDGPHPGDRLPDEDVTHDGRLVRLHELTARPGLHVLLRRDALPLDRLRLGPQVTFHRISSWPGRGLVGVRPDGHVGFRCGESDPAQLRAWLELVRPR
jgi:2-polyprenyl-6-methoxyphenol hydroxylase-like FAD-dependent oxidoreductase